MADQRGRLNKPQRGYQELGKDLASDETSGLVAQEPEQPTTAQWTPLDTKEMPNEVSYSDLLGEAKENDRATYDTLREQSAKDLLDANIQTELAKTAANKALATRMGAMGLGNSGYAGTQAGNIQSAYMQGINKNTASYQDALRDISLNEEAQAKSDALRQQELNTEERRRIEDYNDNVNVTNAKMAYEDAVRAEKRQQDLEDSETKFEREKALFDYKNAYTEKQNDESASYARVENALEDISQYAGQPNFDSIVKDNLDALGVSYELKDGKYEFSGEGWDNLDQNSKDNIRRTMTNIYNAQNQIYTSYENMLQSDAKTVNGSSISEVKDEVEELFDNKYIAKDGAVYKLENGHKSDTYTFMKYENGQWKQISEANAGSNYGLIKNGDVSKTYMAPKTETKPAETKAEDKKPSYSDVVEESANKGYVGDGKDLEMNTKDASTSAANLLNDAFKQFGDVYGDMSDLKDKLISLYQNKDSKYSKYGFVEVKGKKDSLYLRRDNKGNWYPISKDAYTKQGGNKATIG